MRKQLIKVTTVRIHQLHTYGVLNITSDNTCFGHINTCLLCTQKYTSKCCHHAPIQNNAIPSYPLKATSLSLLN